MVCWENGVGVVGKVQADGKHGGSKGMWNMEGEEGEWRAAGVVEEDGECSVNVGKVRMKWCSRGESDGGLVPRAKRL